MAQQYSLTLRNRSTNPSWTFAVYTDAAMISNTNRFALAWLTHQTRSNNNVTFNWELNYSLMFATQGFKQNVRWTETGAVNVSDKTWEQNCARLSHPGSYDFSLAPETMEPVPGQVFIKTAADVPAYNPTKGPTVALAITGGVNGELDPKPCIAGTSGPNLQHTFTLHPTYYIQAGDVQEGQMATLDTLNNMQAVSFVNGTYTADWTLNKSNIWVPTGSTLEAEMPGELVGV